MRNSKKKQHVSPRLGIRSVKSILVWSVLGFSFEKVIFWDRNLSFFETCSCSCQSRLRNALEAPKTKLFIFAWFYRYFFTCHIGCLSMPSGGDSSTMMSGMSCMFNFGDTSSEILRFSNPIRIARSDQGWPTCPKPFKNKRFAHLVKKHYWQSLCLWGYPPDPPLRILKKYLTQQT